MAPVPRPRFTPEKLSLSAHSSPINPVEHDPAAPPNVGEAVASLEGSPAL